MLIAVQQIVNLFHKEMQNTPRFGWKCAHFTRRASVKHIIFACDSYALTNAFSRLVWMDARNRLEKRMQVNTHPLLSFSLSISQPHRHTHTLTHIPTHFLRFRWFWSDFMVAVLLMVPVKHETLLFPPNHTHMHCLWAVIHRQPETKAWRQLYQARESCQVLHWATRIHIYTLILDLYDVLHPPLSTAVKVFLNSCKSSAFKEVHARTHKHTAERHTDF